MKVAYISGPYRADEPWQVDVNIALAEAAMVKLMRLGYAVICPHRNTSKLEHYPDWEAQDIIDMDLEILRRLWPSEDVIYMLEGWENSEGALKELNFAQELGLEVMYDEAAYRPFPGSDGKVILLKRT